MDKSYTEGQVLEKILPEAKGEYLHCRFQNCDWGDADLSGCIFSECVFENCNLSGAKLQKTAFRSIDFKDCKLMGLHFDLCNDFLFSVNFYACSLRYASFYSVKLKGSVFSRCDLQESDFTQSDCTEVVFEDCELQQAVFENTILEKADLRSAYHFNIDPSRNRIRKARFASQNVSGLLHAFDLQFD